MLRTVRTTPEFRKLRSEHTDYKSQQIGANKFEESNFPSQKII